MKFRMKVRKLDGQQVVCDNHGDLHPMVEWTADKSNSVYLALRVRLGSSRPMICVAKNQDVGFSFTFFDTDSSGFAVHEFKTRALAWEWYESISDDTRPAARRGQDERDGQPHTLNRGKSIIQRMRAKRAEREGWSTHVEDALAEVEDVETCKLSVLEAPPHECDRKDGFGLCPLDVAEMEKTAGLPDEAKDSLIAQWLTAHRDSHPPIDATNHEAITQETWKAREAGQPIVLYCRACVAPISMFIPREG
jgi:hypothetical protein